MDRRSAMTEDATHDDIIQGGRASRLCRIGDRAEAWIYFDKPVEQRAVVMRGGCNWSSKWYPHNRHTSGLEHLQKRHIVRMRRLLMPAAVYTEV